MNRVQALQFELMKLASFNEFDGPMVVDSLAKNEDLWDGVVFQGNDLISLRDIKYEQWNHDTVFITPKIGKEDDLYSLAQKWKADEVDWIGCNDACGRLGSYSPESRKNAKQILRVWWD